MTVINMSVYNDFSMSQHHRNEQHILKISAHYKDTNSCFETYDPYMQQLTVNMRAPQCVWLCAYKLHFDREAWWPCAQSSISTSRYKHLERQAPTSPGSVGDVSWPTWWNTIPKEGQVLEHDRPLFIISNTQTRKKRMEWIDPKRLKGHWNDFVYFQNADFSCSKYNINSVTLTVNSSNYLICQTYYLIELYKLW